MDVSKYVSPLTRNLKGNSVNINLVLIIVVLFLMFPLDQMLKVLDEKRRLEQKFSITEFTNISVVETIKNIIFKIIK